MNTETAHLNVTIINEFAHADLEGWDDYYWTKKT
jgi:hypothetical protein